ncbi:MAG: hypothetical protein ABII19_01405 [Patescibacteria group bacterium]
MKKILIIGGLVILAIGIFVLYNNYKPWMLSLYGNGSTIMRLEYSSKDACLSAGQSYITNKSAERFDCGYKCSSFDRSDLQASPLCKTVCNDSGCR